MVIIESPYRSLVGPLLAYLDEIDRQRPDDTLTVVLPEFIARHWWEQILHNQTALRIKAALLFRPGTVVTSVPYHLERRVALRRSLHPTTPPNGHPHPTPCPQERGTAAVAGAKGLRSE